MAHMPSRVLISSATFALGCGFVSVQASPLSTDTIQITGDDPAYGFNAGYNYQVVDLTVTDAAAFTFDVTRLIRLDTDAPLTMNVLAYLFRVGDVLPVNPTSQLDHENAADAVARISDGNPNGEAPVTATDLAAGPLTDGQYQLVIAPFDLFGSQGDQELTFSVTGGVLVLLPTAAQEMAQLAYSNGLGSRMAAGGAANTAGRQGRLSLATRNAAGTHGFRRASVSGGLAVAASSRGTGPAPGLVGNTYTWIEITGFELDDSATDRAIIGRGLQIGADWGIGDTWVAGLSFAVDAISSSGAGFTQEGVLRTIQPYVALEAGAFHGEASLLWGWGDFTQTSIGGTGTGESELRAASLSIGYDFSAWGDTVLTPSFAALYGEERITGTGGTLAGAAEMRVAFTELSLGTTLSRGFGNGLDGSIGVYGDWVDIGGDGVLVDELFADHGWSGRVAIGLSGEMPNGLGIQTSVELGGLGSDARAIRGALRVAFRF